MNNIQNKSLKIELKRLLIYLALSFGLTWIIFFSFIIAGFKWDGSNENMERLVGLGMLMPFLAHLLTRWITKEGFAMTGKGSLMLGINLKDKKWKYYIFAFIIPWFYFEIMHLLALILLPESYDTNILKEVGYDNIIAYLYPFITMVSCAIGSFATLGEEGGWRGYMMPKLIKLVGAPKAVIIGGIIWGLWHAPLTCIGHNFGTDYWGFPYVGIIIMCVDCILMGVMLTYVTIKTQSIWPATIMHAVNNGNPSVLLFFVNADIFAEKYQGPLYSYLLMLLPMAAIDMMIIIKWSRTGDTLTDNMQSNNNG